MSVAVFQSIGLIAVKLWLLVGVNNVEKVCEEVWSQITTRCYKLQKDDLLALNYLLLNNTQSTWNLFLTAPFLLVILNSIRNKAI